MLRRPPNEICNAEPNVRVRKASRYLGYVPIGYWVVCRRRKFHWWPTYKRNHVPAAAPPPAPPVVLTPTLDANRKLTAASHDASFGGCRLCCRQTYAIWGCEYFKYWFEPPVAEKFSRFGERRTTFPARSRAAQPERQPLYGFGVCNISAVLLWSQNSRQAKSIFAETG